MARRSKPHPWADRPDLLTSIRSPWDHYRKLDWNFSRYEDATFARPCDSEAVVYTALDFAVSVLSLRDWTKRWLIRQSRGQMRSPPLGMDRFEDFDDWVRAKIPWQKAVEAIANTTKHGQYRDSGWEQGIAMPESFFPETLREEHEACDDGLELFVFMHKHREQVWWDIAFRQGSSANAEPGCNVLGSVLDGWKSILTELDLVED